MRSQRKRHLFLGLGLAMTLGLVVALPATASAVSTLNGEQLAASGGSDVPCQTGGPYSYTASGTATGPYPGTFTETGSGTVTHSPGVFGSMTLSASFTIHSGDFLITGSKSGGVSGNACQDTSGNTGGSVNGLSYQATIHTSRGNYADQGTSNAFVSTGPSSTFLFESFTSSLAQPVLIAPTSKDQCKNNGWKNFPQFKNQGQCVSFVERRPRT